MNHIRRLILLACLVFAASALAQDVRELKIYDVDPDNRDEIYSALNNVVGGGVQMLPGGQILINTTPAMHQQVAMVLEAISRNVGPTPRVTLQYWIVLGSRDGPDAEMPAVLEDVLDEIGQVHGRLSFQLLGNATLVTDSGMSGRAQGDLMVNQVAYVQGTKLNANLEIAFTYETMTTSRVPQADGQIQETVFTGQKTQRLELNTSMERGEFVVVGENSIDDTIPGLGEVDGTIFYVVHWSAAD